MDSVALSQVHDRVRRRLFSIELPIGRSWSDVRDLVIVGLPTNSRYVIKPIDSVTVELDVAGGLPGGGAALQLRADEDGDLFKVVNADSISFLVAGSDTRRTAPRSKLPKALRAMQPAIDAAILAWQGQQQEQQPPPPQLLPPQVLLPQVQQQQQLLLPPQQQPQPPQRWQLLWVACGVPLRCANKMLGLIVPMMTSHLGKAIFSPALHA